MYLILWLFSSQTSASKVSVLAGYSSSSSASSEDEDEGEEGKKNNTSNSSATGPKGLPAGNVLADGWIIIYFTNATTAESLMLQSHDRTASALLLLLLLSQ